MRRLKPILLTLAIICIISLWIYLSAVADYRWAESVIAEEIQNGWTLIIKQDNLVNITAPWSLIKTPVTGLWFIDNEDINKLSQDIYQIHTLRVSYDYSQTDRGESSSLINVRKRESAFINPDSSLNIETLIWENYEIGTPGCQIIDYIVKNDIDN
ncbi:MAG: hypothetical protein GF353_28350 [Candidatus Lokiarchaeota archaeon]|nr:hypothetical protein [Candidatus Lokiarchaeota archaeon]